MDHVRILYCKQAILLAGCKCNKLSQCDLGGNAWATQGSGIRRYMTAIPAYRDPLPIIFAYVDLNLQTPYTAGLLPGPPPSPTVSAHRPAAGPSAEQLQTVASYCGKQAMPEARSTFSPASVQADQEEDQGSRHPAICTEPTFNRARTTRELPDSQQTNGLAQQRHCDVEQLPQERNKAEAAGDVRPAQGHLLHVRPPANEQASAALLSSSLDAHCCHQLIC